MPSNLRRVLAVMALVSFPLSILSPAHADGMGPIVQVYTESLGIEQTEPVVRGHLVLTLELQSDAALHKVLFSTIDPGRLRIKPDPVALGTLQPGQPRHLEIDFIAYTKDYQPDDAIQWVLEFSDRSGNRQAITMMGRRRE